MSYVECKTFFRSGLPVALVISALGCKVDINEPATNQPAAASTSSATTTAGAKGLPTSSTATSATSGSSRAATTAGSSPTATKTEEKPKSSAEDQLAKDKKNPAYNPARLYQLFNLKTAPITINGQNLTAWIADNESLRQEGLMFVKDNEIKPGEAMIFVFPDAKEQGFWMHNTYIPLDIAYIGSDKAVVSTATMKPLDETNVPSHGKAQFVLEMKVGTLQRLGIAKGTKIGIPDSVKATQ